MRALLFMELKEFIKSAITQLSEAVYELNDELKDKGVVVNPCYAENTNFETIDNSEGVIVSSVEFDLQVSTSEIKENSGKIGVLASVVGIGASTKEGSNGNEANRIRFKLPVVLPYKKPYGCLFPWDVIPSFIYNSMSWAESLTVKPLSLPSWTLMAYLTQRSRRRSSLRLRK